MTIPSEFSSFKIVAPHRLRQNRIKGYAITGAKIKISMDGRGRYLDNIFIKHLWRSLKQETVYLHEL
ncbi:hypothetical protein DZK27_14910 [Rhodobacteraceae bacterium 63075]|nr:hypothetical protein DZK27_14910 [Rhodobacteraceae bacterium 63075]